MAPKREGKVVNVRLPDDMLAMLDVRCARSGLSRAQTIRSLLGWALAAQSGVGAANEEATAAVSDEQMKDFVASFDSPRSELFD